MQLNIKHNVAAVKENNTAEGIKSDRGRCILDKVAQESLIGDI